MMFAWVWYPTSFSPLCREVTTFKFIEHIRLAERMMESVTGEKPVTDDPDRRLTDKVLHPNDQVIVLNG